MAKVFRTKFLIYPNLQLKMIIINVIILFISIGAIAIQVIRTFSHLSLMGQKVNFVEGHPYYKFLDLQKDLLSSYTLWALVISILCSIIFTLFLSHKVAGPFVRLKSYFDEIAATGKFMPLKFRKSDFFTDLPDKINNALNKISK